MSKKLNDKFKFDDHGLLKKLRAKAAPADPQLMKDGRDLAKKSSKKRPPKNALRKLSSKSAKRIIES